MIVRTIIKQMITYRKCHFAMHIQQVKVQNEGHFFTQIFIYVTCPFTSCSEKIRVKEFCMCCSDGG